LTALDFFVGYPIFRFQHGPKNLRIPFGPAAVRADPRGRRRDAPRTPAVMTEISGISTIREIEVGMCEVTDEAFYVGVTADVASLEFLSDSCEWRFVE